MNKENENSRMEESIRESIRDSAKNVSVPENLRPENITRKLENREPEKRKGFSQRRRFLYGLAAAALLFVCCGVMLRFGWTVQNKKGEMVGLSLSAGLEIEKAAEDPGEGIQENSLYRQAADYGEVYDVVMMPVQTFPAAMGDLEMDLVMEDGMMAESGEMPVAEENSAVDLPSQKSEARYSATNLQVQGVDESDIIKTDGSYLYIARSDGIHIVDIRGAQMKEASVIGLPAELSAGTLREFYTDENRLSLIVCRGESRLLRKDEREDSGSGDVIDMEAYYVSTKVTTSLYTYDITDRSVPRLIGKISQDGRYRTSRKIGDIVYLFSEDDLYQACADSSRLEKQWVPAVNGEAIGAERIYIPERGQSGLIVSSVSLENPSETVDEAMVLSDYANIYVTGQSLYLYNEVYDYGMPYTQVARFSLKDGRIAAAAAASVSGYVTDTFAVSESGDSFRILTTDNGGNYGNCLYLFDLDLNPTGSLTRIAPGERIYAARYLGDIVYFVTYRNMDPLFAVDLSDVSAPKLLGELKITGYSDYLHVWKEDTLLGLGYETDPDTGEQKGLKLAMFDVSDPVNLKTLDSMVIKNMDFSPALDNYKCVLAEPEANLIGFAARGDYSSTDGWDKGYYLLFDWQDGKFRSLLTEELAGSASGDRLASCRGLYVGDTFYLVNSDEIISFDRKDGYRETDRLVLE